MKVGSLFAGIGGFDLAAQWVGWRTAWFSEIDPYASRVLAKHWPGVPNHGDITKVQGTDVESVDVLCGGFPCQDLSYAGRGAGLTGARSGLWSHFARLIGELRPSWVVIENVPALRGRGLDRVLGEIAALGYDAEWHCIPAASIGALHWIIAYPGGQHIRIQPGGSGGASGSGSLFAGLYGEVESVADADRTRQLQSEGVEQVQRGWPGDGGADVADTAQQSKRESDDKTNAVAGGGDAWPVPGLGGWWESEPDVGRVAHGVPARVDRLRCLGNAIVPQVAYLIFRDLDFVGR